MEEEVIYSYIYSLTDPFTDKIRYIGQTEDVQSRFARHCYEKGKSNKSLWIKSLIERQKLPILTILEKCPIEFASARESFYIINALSTGQPLFNKHTKHIARTANYHFEFKLSLRGLLKMDAKNSAIFEGTLLNQIIEQYYMGKLGFIEITPQTDIAKIKTI